VIFFWFACLIREIRWFFTWPKSIDVARINKNAPCPVCGARSGKLQTVHMQENAAPSYVVSCQHTCTECEACWYERPVVSVTPATVKGKYLVPELLRAKG
jgi:C4-type Zn-finger protein